MTQDSITKQLEKFDYNYFDREGEISVKLGFSLESKVDFSEKDKVKLSNHLGDARNEKLQI